jgi:hypothetical protein
VSKNLGQLVHKKLFLLQEQEKLAIAMKNKQQKHKIKVQYRVAQACERLELELNCRDEQEVIFLQ